MVLPCFYVLLLFFLYSLMGFNRLYQVLPSFIEFYLVLPGFTGFFMVLPCCCVLLLAFFVLRNCY